MGMTSANVCSDVQWAMSGSSADFGSASILLSTRMTGQSRFLTSWRAKSSSALERARFLFSVVGVGFFFDGQTMRDIDDKEHGVTRFQCVVDFLHHALVELGFGLVDTWGVDQDDLCHRPSGVALGFFSERKFEDALDAGARGLRLVCDDRELLAKKRVQQRRLARIGATDDGDKSGA